MLPSYRNQSIDLLCKSVDWFLYEGNTGIKPNLRKLPNYGNLAQKIINSQLLKERLPDIFVATLLFLLLE